MLMQSNHSRSRLVCANQNLGDIVPNDGSTAQNFAKIGLSEESDQKLYQLMDKIQHTLEVLDEKGNNLVRKIYLKNIFRLRGDNMKK